MKTDILKSNQRETITFQGATTSLISDFSTETLEARRQQTDIFGVERK